ncbi:hypothetical protein [Leptothoe sp. PORK10 BA2]|uniref:hypothetical protein n=1 Tax=Leptothoe sp. PORK10 BA2 TaxID=3110254 RepID=UPI002B1F94A4|nr:hypothetical protein [Leptothoe sp. PORK10 BA2]MEA5463036.1 hypothetical protein [Leptothoe sp. PORK10 BA2]
MPLPQGLPPVTWDSHRKSHRQSPKISRQSWVVSSLLLTTLISCRAPSPDIPAEPTIPAPAEGSSAPSSPLGSAPPPPPPNSYLAQLPPEATNQLVSLNIDIAIPTYLPPTMTLANYGVGTAAEETGGGAYYWLVYRDEKNRCFAIEYTANGTDDISLENQVPVDTVLFGAGYSLYHGKFPNGGAGELPESDFFTDWLAGEDGFYRLVGAGLINSQDYGQGDCSNISVKEAISITESLSYLPTDIRTLELIPPKTDGVE